MSGGSSAPPVCEVEPIGGDGLVNPELFVIESHALPTAASQIEAAGDYLCRMGDDLHGTMDDISTAWWRLAGCYEAPEATSVYTLLNPACESAGQARAALSTAAIFLRDYATAVASEREPLRDLTARANQFRRDVVDGVTIPKSESASATFWDTVTGIAGADDLVTVPWYEDGPTRNRNQALLEEHAAIAHRINTAAVTCANGINGIVGHLPAGVDAPEVIPEWALASNEVPMPWGYPAEEDRNWLEALGHVGWRFGNEFGTAVAGLTGYDTLMNERTGATAAQNWAGLGDGLGSLLVSAAAAPLVIGSAQVPEGERAAWMQWFVDRGDVTAAAVGGAVSIDYQAGGSAMFAQWSDDPVEAGGYAAVNVASLFAGFGFLSASRAAMIAARTGAMSTRVARIVALAGQVGEFVIPTSEILAAGGLRIVTGLRHAVRLSEFDGITIHPAQFTDEVARLTTNDSISVTVEDAPPQAPLSDDLFGTGGTDAPPPVADDATRTADYHPQTDAEAHTAHPQPTDTEVPPTPDRDVAEQYRNDVLVDQAEAIAARQGAMDTLHELGFDVGPSDLTVGNIRLTTRRLQAELGDSDLVGTAYDEAVDAINDLQAAAWDERHARTARYEATETLGDVGLGDRFDSAGARVLIEPGGQGPGRFDGVGYLPEERVLLVGEAKGGRSTLSSSGRLLADGSRAAQGSTMYFNDVWANDPQIAQMLAENPEIAQGLADGSISVRYELVHTAADGTVKVSTLQLDPSRLSLDLGLDTR
ncbi:hypothetical protein [Pseudactinotalea sp.]|uniref:hypothetical protein n=1 Tax=Pseudactinotalea sp. TaxID=1926260 RepID=UPI003B3A9957